MQKVTDWVLRVMYHKIEPIALTIFIVSIFGRRKLETDIFHTWLGNLTMCYKIKCINLHIFNIQLKETHGY